MIRLFDSLFHRFSLLVVFEIMPEFQLDKHTFCSYFVNKFFRISKIKNVHL